MKLPFKGNDLDCQFVENTGITPWGPTLPQEARNANSRNSVLPAPRAREDDLADLLRRVAGAAEDYAPISISAGVLRAAAAEIERLRVLVAGPLFGRGQD